MRSRESFAGRAKEAREREFLFVCEDMCTGNVVGTSTIVSANSWPGHPHTFLRVCKRELYSQDLNTGQVHVTLQLDTDESGASEIGGLIVSPAYRRHPEKIGAMLSMIRFHLVGLHRDWFNNRMMAEMMAPLTPDSRNTLWEYLGRRFINLSYAEADLFCQYSKEFITSLFPKDEIYVSLLPAVARNLIGRVGPETEPAKAMLERLGFQYRGHVDPFDGGPYLEASVDDIPLVVNTKMSTLAEPQQHLPTLGFVSTQTSVGFRALRTHLAEVDGKISIGAKEAEALGAQPGDRVGYVSLAAGTPGGAERTQFEVGARMAINSRNHAGEGQGGRKRRSDEATERRRETV
jgi:arginine N-succinyltransferase